jgi:hypothetical protein
MTGSVFRTLTHNLTTLSSVAYDLVRLLVLAARSRRAVAAENLYLRKQLALFQEPKVKAHRAHDSTRLIMVILGRMFWWRDALVNVQPDRFLRWHRQGFRLLWRWKSRRPGRPRLPKDLRRLIREMDRIPQDSPSKRYGPSHGGMDAAAVPGSSAGRSSLPLPHP